MLWSSPFGEDRPDAASVGCMMAKMAKTTAKTAVTRAKRTEQAIRHAVVMDWLRGWTLPLVGIFTAILMWLLATVSLIEMSTGLEIAAVSLFVAAVHAGVHEFLDERTTAATAATLVAFVALLAFVALGPLHEFLKPGPPLATAELHRGDPEVALPVGGLAGTYRITLEGHLDQTGGQVTRTVPYRLGVTTGTNEPDVLEGEFSERWGRQRLGRRGSAQVHIVRGGTQHVVTDGTGDDLRLSLQSIGEGAHSVTAEVHRSSFPDWLFFGLGLALTAAAILVDSWREAGAGNLPLTLVTLCMVFAVAAIRRFAAPHPQFGELIFYGGVGTVGGFLTGSVVSRAKRALGR